MSKHKVKKIIVQIPELLKCSHSFNMVIRIAYCFLVLFVSIFISTGLKFILLALTYFLKVAFCFSNTNEAGKGQHQLVPETNKEALRLSSPLFILFHVLFS